MRTGQIRSCFCSFLCRPISIINLWLDNLHLTTYKERRKCAWDRAETHSYLYTHTVLFGCYIIVETTISYGNLVQGRWSSVKDNRIAMGGPFSYTKRFTTDENIEFTYLNLIGLILYWLCSVIWICVLGIVFGLYFVDRFVIYSVIWCIYMSQHNKKPGLCLWYVTVCLL